MKKDFELLAHTADLKIRVYGDTQKELFAHALIGMFQSISADAPTCAKKNDRLVCSNFTSHYTIIIKSSDSEMLLVDFLSEALYLSDVHNEVYLKVDIQEIDEQNIKAILYGVSVKGFELEIKAVTYHGLYITHQDNKWMVDIVFDI